jgi:hypothetical protein
MGVAFLIDGTQIFDAQTWQRLPPPAGKKLHPAVARFATDGRFLLTHDYRGDTVVVDAKTEKQFAVSDSWAVGSSWGDRSRLGELPNWGHLWAIKRLNGLEIRIIPFYQDKEIPPSLLQLWAQVAVRGQLNDQGEFVIWTESDWEKKRQELAAIPPPIKDFPFPGYVATDKLHWLRAEYNEETDETEKKRLAQELLRKAEESGDKIEAMRWQAIVTPPSVPSPATEPK